MRRRCLAVVALSLAVGVGLAACDYDDGREMQQPSELQRFRLQSTSTTTTSTTTLAPTTPPILTTVPTSIVESASIADPVADLEPLGTAGAAQSEPADLESDSAAALAAPDAAGSLLAPWPDGGAIDVSYTCDGAGDAPLIEWGAPPEGTVEVALTVVDDDANGYVHWAVFGLPATAGSIGGGAPLTAGVEGRNSRSGTGWTGPCPPAGSTHDYRVTVHFLAQQLEETADAAPSALVAAIESVAFDQWSVTGTYQRAA